MDHPNLVTVPESAVFDYSSPFQYGWFCMNDLIAIWFLAAVFEYILPRIRHQNIGDKYLALSLDKQKNVITYIMQLIVTTMSFIFQIIGGIDIVFKLQDDTPQYRLDWLAFVLQAVSVLYMWELIYRQTIGWPLLIHHLIAVVFFQCGTSSLYETGDVIYVRFMTVMGMYATTEQISFIALICFRLDIFPKWQSILFYVAAVQAFLLKLLVTILIFTYFIAAVYVNGELEHQRTNWKWFWKIALIPVILVLYAAQLYAIKILMALGTRCKKDALKSKDKEDNEGEDDGEGEIEDDQYDDIEAASNTEHTAIKRRRSSGIVASACTEQQRQECELLLSAFEDTKTVDDELFDKLLHEFRERRESQLRSSGAARKAPDVEDLSSKTATTDGQEYQETTPASSSAKFV